MSLFRVLGPVTVGAEPSDPVSFAAPKARALLAALLLNPDQWVSKGRLASYLWPAPPLSAEPNLRGYATDLRRALNAVRPGLATRLETRRGGGGGDFRLRTNRPEIDRWLFEHNAIQGVKANARGNHREAAELLAAALNLWRGQPGMDLPDTPPFRDDFSAMQQLRRQAELDLYNARLRLGEAAAVLTALRQLAKEEPLAEVPTRLLIRALAGVAEPAAAIATYLDYRKRLVDETGTDPSQEMEGLYLRILRRTS